MRGIKLTLVLMIFCPSPLTVLAQRLVITPAGVTVEEGASAEFPVVLSSAPTGDVTATVMQSNGRDLSLDKSLLTSTSTNWGIPQQVTMMAGEESLGTDPDSSRSRGSVGVWGSDFCDSTLISLTYHKDVVGCCYDQGWLSDYVHEDEIDYREPIKAKREQPLADASHKSDMLVLWGSVQGGELRIEPLFSASVPSQLPEVDGPYHLEGFGGDVILFSLSFTLGQDKFGKKVFLSAAPVGQDLEESLDRIVLTGPEGSVAIGAEDQRKSSAFRDALTGEVRGIPHDWEGDLPAALRQAGDLSVMPALGLTDSIRQRRLVLSHNHNIQIEILGK